MIFCPKYNAEQAKRARFCNQCGTKISQNDNASFEIINDCVIQDKTLYRYVG